MPDWNNLGARIRSRRRSERGSRAASTRFGALGVVIGLLILINLVLLRVFDPTPVQVLRNQVFDLYQRATATSVAEPVVAIIDIDEASLAELGQWPWPRTTVARLIGRLQEAGALAIGVDIVFAEPDRVSPPRLADEMPSLDAATRDSMRALPDSDEVLARTIARGRVVLAEAGLNSEATGAPPPVTKASIAVLGTDPKRFALDYARATRNIAPLEQAAAGIGMIGLAPEADGVTRRIPLVTAIGDRVTPTLSLEMLRVATGQSTIGVRSNDAGIENVLIAGTAIPTDDRGLAWVRFAAPGSFPYVPARDVLADDFDPARVQGRFVLIGTSATGLLDIKTTPVAAFMPGVEIHAHFLQNVLSGTVLARPNYVTGAEVMAMSIVSLVIILVTPFVSAAATLALGGAVMAATAGASWYLFTEEAVLFDVTATAVASFAVYGMLTYLKYLREERDRKQIRRTFAQYLSPAVVERLARDPDRLKLGGEMREMTILFGDIRGFTTLAEFVSAEQLTDLINRILTPLTESVLEFDGTVDKYMGDCIMAFWNAPLDDDGHARHAAAAALDMLIRLEALNDSLAEEHKAEGGEASAAPRIGIGIGINSGTCCVGNMGSRQRFDYSVLGDTVNLASRLEGQSRYYGCPIVLGPETAAELPDLAVLGIDRVRVIGREQPSDIHALLGDERLAAGDGFKALKREHEAMMTAYFAGAWDRADQARAAAERLAAEQSLPLDKVYAIYAERLETRRGQPVPADWDGVFVAIRK